MKESQRDKERKLFFVFSEGWEAEISSHGSKEPLDETSGKKNFLTIKVLKHRAGC